ncbi:hypothetical protein LCGC14_0565670 [marine sediment metagenome]|uniref:Uncharacterized protein n=1 Tax=marine sediment metagenome TaxID=412755 RepID=A0A0F9RKJ4_9ZZZZ
MIISKQTGLTLPQQAAPLLSQTPGEFGFAITTALIIGAGTLLGGGTLWQFHEKRKERSDYLECIETYTAAPYSMAPEEAAMMCGGEVQKGFKFGMNAQSFLLIAASVFGMWFVTQLMITAAKSRIGGKK